MIIENEVKPPIVKAKTTRARKPKVQENKSAKLIAALKFVGQILHKKDNAYCVMQNGFVFARSESIFIGTKIEEDLNCIPHLFKLLDALQKCKHEVVITQVSERELTVESGDFKASVDCMDLNSIYLPDRLQPCAVLDNTLKTAFENIYGILVETHIENICKNVFVKSGSMFSTNRFAILEYWHGINLPEMLIPKQAAKAICKTEKELSGFGYSNGIEATFYYKDESFVHVLLTQRNESDSKIIDKAMSMLNRNDLNFWEVPENFFIATKNVASFTEQGTVYFDGNGINSNNDGNLATSYKVDGLPVGMAFNARLLLSVQHAMSKVAFLSEEKKCYFIGNGNNIRGLVAAWSEDSSYNSDVPYVKETDPTETSEDYPF